MNELLTKASVQWLQEWNLKQHGKEDLIPLLNGDLTARQGSCKIMYKIQK